MAFPNTGILDDFNRADANPIGGNWTKDPSFADLQILSSQLAVVGGATTYGGAYWNTSFSGDLEIYIDVPVGLTGREIDLGVYKGFVGAARDGYLLNILTVAGTDTFKLFRTDNAANTQLGATISQEIASGDAVGLEWIGSTLTIYYKAAAGSWVSLGSRTDATYTPASIFLDVIFQGSVIRLDNFGGGAIVTGQPMQLRGTTVPRLRQWQPRGLRG